MKKQKDWLFLLPAILVVAVMTQIPFILTIIYSTLKWNLSRPDLGITFNGLKNYLYYLKIDDFQNIPEFYSIFWQTIVLTVSTLIICSVVGFLFSILLDHAVPGINIARTLIMGPFFVMSTASGVIWKTTILNTTFGWYGVIFKSLGLKPIDLLSYRPLAVIILLFSWQWIPFFVLIILAGLQGIPQDVEDSVKVDGANWFRKTFEIKLPMISEHMMVAVMLGLIFIVKEIGLILVTTAGGPGTRSYNLPYAVYMEIFNGSQVGRAGALATMTVIITLISVNILYRIIRKRKAMYE
ncbi:MAG: sugar ABC transporter permease [Spirochaetales bacterium]|nr:sugar ABC transporter permease [Spirochaetales bacterium]